MYTHKSTTQLGGGPLRVTGDTSNKQSLYPLVEENNRRKKTNLPGEGIPKFQCYRERWRRV